MTAPMNCLEANGNDLKTLETPMSMKTKAAPISRTRRPRTKRLQQGQPRETPTCDDTGAATDMYAILILKALIDAAAFTEARAVTVDALQEITGIEVQEIQFLACQLAAPGFAVLEGPTPAISETAIEHLYIETEPDRLLSFSLGLVRNGGWALGRAGFYTKHTAAMHSKKHPWTDGGLVAAEQPSGDGAASKS